MKFARVVGTVVCTQRDPALVGIKLLVLQPLSARLEAQGSPYIAADGIGQAGVGDIVAVVFRGDAPEAFTRDRVPVDASTVGIVDPATARRLAGA
jgi:microcompartment protein CcmK/EutM